MISRFKHLLVIVPVLSLLSISAVAQDNCMKVDLQAVSVSPVGISLQKGKTMEIEVVMRNNGPCIIPVGDATVQITITADQIELAKPFKIKDECNQWEFLTETMAGKNYNLFFRNTKAPIPVGGAMCAFRFSVKGKSDAPGLSRITLASSLSATARTSDMDGNNQSAYAEFAVGGLTETSPAVPAIQLDFVATPDNCYANLAWQGIENLEKYEVEQSIDNVQWKSIATLSSQDQKANGFEYSAEQGASRKYYRLKGITSTGKPIFSKSTIVETKCAAKKGFAP